MRGDGHFLQNLVNIELISCFNCEQVPTLGHLPHLEVVVMDHFDNLKRIGPDFYGLDGIIVGGGSSCNGASPAAAVFPALRKLTLRLMPELEEWSDISSSYVVAGRTMEFFPCLEMLCIFGCPQLRTIPGHLLSIQCLSIAKGSADFKGEWLGGGPYLTFGARDSTSIALLMPILLDESSKSLRNLSIEGLEEQYLPNRLLELSSLETLEIMYCSNLTSIIEDKEAAFDGLTSLERLSIQGCVNLRCLPKWLLQPTLVTLEISWCPNLEMEHPDELCTLSSLEDLHIEVCRRLKSVWEEGLLWPASLKKLVIGGFSEELEYFPWPSSPSIAVAANKEFPFISLESLSLKGWDKLKYLPNQLQHLTTLRELKISSFEGLEALPEWLGNLSSLESLHLWGCNSLTSFLSLETMQRLTNLHTVDLYDCQLLWNAICEESGEELPKIYRNVSVVWRGTRQRMERPSGLIY